jgi:hypothetical protein
MFVKEFRIALEPKWDIANTFHLARSITTCWRFIKTRGARGPKSKTARSTFFFCGVGSCTLREIAEKSLLKHRAH